MGGVVLSLAIAALASGDVASRRFLLRSIDELEMERTTIGLLEYLRSQPSSSPAWMVHPEGWLQGTRVGFGPSPPS